MKERVAQSNQETAARAALERQHPALALGLVPDVAVLLVHPDHDPGVLRAAHDGREHGPGRVVPREAGLAHATAVVDDERCSVLLTHDEIKVASLALEPSES